MGRFGVKEVSNVTLYNLVTQEPELFLDTLKLSNLENAAEEAFATGGQGGSRLVGWDYNRTANFNVQDALLNPKAIAMQVGNALEKKIERIRMREVVVAEDNAGTVEVKFERNPVAGSVKLYKTEDGYVQGAKVETFTVATNVATLTGVTDGEQLLAYYIFETTEEAETITISSNKFGGYYQVVGDTFWRNEKTGEDEKVQIFIPKAKISSAFTLTMQPDGDPSVFDFNLSVFKDPNSTDMVKLIRYK